MAKAFAFKIMVDICFRTGYTVINQTIQIITLNYVKGLLFKIIETVE